MRSERETPNGRSGNCTVKILALRTLRKKGNPARMSVAWLKFPSFFFSFFCEPAFGPVSKREPWSVTVSHQKEESICGTQQTAAVA